MERHVTMSGRQDVERKRQKSSRMDNSKKRKGNKKLCVYLTASELQKNTTVNCFAVGKYVIIGCVLQDTSAKRTRRA